MQKDKSAPKIGFLFDLDGVIIDSEKEYSRIWARVNKEFPTGIESLEEKIKGTTLDKILSEHYPDPEIQKYVVKRLYEMEAAMKYEYKSGSENFLIQLESNHFPMALVTSSNEVKMKHLDEELPELRVKFDFIVTADKITRSKPDPEGYLLAAKNLDCNPSNCVVFEDSLQGVKAGKAAGCYVVGVAGTLKSEVLTPYADKVVDSIEECNLNDLVNILKQR